jgi:hypothetical protein
MGETPSDLIDTLIKSKEILFNFAMLWLGIGGILLCWVLYTRHLAPRFLSLWGIIGYICLFISGWAGLFDAPAVIGYLLYVPGGLFEVLGLPVWLFAKGFSEREALSS